MCFSINGEWDDYMDFEGKYDEVEKKRLRKIDCQCIDRCKFRFNECLKKETKNLDCNGKDFGACYYCTNILDTCLMFC